MKQSIVTICFLFLVSGACLSPLVQAAQFTRVYQVDAPSSIVAGSENPVPVTATIYYNNTTPGFQLVVGIQDISLSPPVIVPGTVVSSTDPCVNQPEPAALCAITVPQSSGAEHISFQVGGIFGVRREPGKWDLNITSVLVDTHNKLVPGSVSSKLFQIDLSPVALNIIVPATVPVTVDGVQQPTGPVSIGVGLGQHNVTVPDAVQLNESTRLRFSEWSDGYPATLRSIVVNNSTTLGVDYVIQNLLTLVGVGQNGTERQWYDADTNATFSANQYGPAGGTLGAMGGRLSFQGWYENGQLITNSATVTIPMNNPHTLIASWQMDYTLPSIILLAIVAAVILAITHRRANKTKAKTRSRTARKRS